MTAHSAAPDFDRRQGPVEYRCRRSFARPGPGAQSLSVRDGGFRKCVHRSELAAAEIPHRLDDLLPRVHHEGTVADDRLVERLAAEQQQGGEDCRGILAFPRLARGLPRCFLA